MDTLPFGLLAGIAIGAAAGGLGTLMLSRRMALVAGPLGHLALPGIALALLWGGDVSLGAFPFVILGVVLIWWFEKITRLPMEALTALVFASGVAAAFLLLPMDRAETALIGDIAKTDADGALLSALGSMAIGIGSETLGILLSRATGVAAGPLVILVNAAIFLLTLPLAR